MTKTKSQILHQLKNSDFQVQRVMKAIGKKEKMKINRQVKYIVPVMKKE